VRANQRRNRSWNPARLPAVPDSPTPIRGYRAWAVKETADGPRLQSLWHVRGTWPPFQRFEARCMTSLLAWHHVPPRPRHTCGVYAVKHVDDVWEWLRRDSPADDRPVVVGEVWCWGLVVEGSAGYRARYAYPASFLAFRFLAPEEERRRLLALAAAYGVPATSTAGTA
jgi:hypothetical protein